LLGWAKGVLGYARRMGAAEDIAACEAALRELIRSVDGNRWTSTFTEDQLKDFQGKRDIDQRRRRGTQLGNDLLDYVELHHLQTHMQKGWSRYEPALGKKKYFDTFLDRLTGLRNAVAHSRELLPFERALVSGITGEIRNLVVIHRNSENLDESLWPVIEVARDGFGTTRTTEKPYGDGTRTTLRPGDVVDFTARGRDAEGAPLQWKCGRQIIEGDIGTATGNEVQFQWVVSARDVGFQKVIIVLTADRDDHRHKLFDALVEFHYLVARPRATP
jgi:hypothetical protein